MLKIIATALVALSMLSGIAPTAEAYFGQSPTTQGGI